MRYKQSPVLIVVFLLLLLVFSQAFNKAAVVSLPKSDSNGFAVIELFTSEGCSSCPSADDVVAKFLEANNQRVHVLAFHVDYWNKLGWKDMFSKAEYTARQNKYASVFGLESIYTPQVVVNGKYEFVGSNRMQLVRVVEKELASGKGKPVHLSVAAIDASHVTISYQLEDKSNEQLNIALVQSKAAAEVKRGENAGRHLDHVNVVRDFKTLQSPALNGQAVLAVPAGFKQSDFTIIAYLQDPVSLYISGIEEIEIQK